jgi:HD-like signal output (HDOD) protein
MVFTLGLLHAIGQLQMHAVNPSDMATLDQKCHVLSSNRAEEETKMQGYHYGDVSAELAKLWNFPTTLTDALRAIPAPQSSKEFSEVAALVHLGAWAARMDAQECDDGEIAASYPGSLADRIGIDAGWIPALKKGNSPPMPTFKELTAGLDAMLE